MGNFDNNKEPSIDNIKNLLVDAANLWVIKLVLTHGESLLRSDLEEIVSIASKLWFYVTLLSNACTITENRALSLKKSGLDKVIVSVDSLSSSVHDELRWVNWALKMALNWIEYLKAANIPFGINTTLNRFMKWTVEDFINFAIDIWACEIDFLPIRKQWRARDNKFSNETLFHSQILIAKKKYAKSILIGYHNPNPRLTSSDSSMCHAWNKWISILPDWSVRPCNFSEFTIGNVYELGLQNILVNMTRHVWKYYCLLNQNAKKNT